MQVNIPGVEHDLQQIEQIDSRLYNNKDTQRVLQELGSKYTNEQQQLRRLCFFKTCLLHLSLKHALYFVFHSWAYELLMSSKTWASGEKPRAIKI